MKKLIAVLLALLLLSNLTLVVLMAQNNQLLKQILATPTPPVSSDAASDQSTPTDPRPEATGDSVELVHVAEDKYLEQDGSWHFSFAIKNTTDTELFIQSLTFIDNGSNRDHRDINSDPPLFEMMMGPNFATEPIRPGEIMVWGDGHPGEYLTSRTYLFTFIGANGTTYTAEYEYNLLMEVQEGGSSINLDYANDQGQQLITLRHEADFEVPVAEDVYWVPVNTLGESAYSNQMIFELVGETPERKQEEIHTLYEALQLYQIGGFAASDDNIRIQENGINWEHHKPGYYAVATNNGCCATSANWLNYILAGDYEEVGFVATSQRDGNGHIYNYIRHDGWYYFIDLTHYRTDWIATAVESGNLDDYYGSDFILGNLHKCRTVEAYVHYVQDKFNDPPGLMFQYTAEDCMAVDSVRAQDGVTIVYEDDPAVSIQVIFDDPNDSLLFGLASPPTNRPNWG